MLKNILKSVKANADFFALISDLKLWRHFLIPILISVTASVLSDTIGNGIVFMFFLLVLVIGVTFIRNISFNPNNQK
jgi:CysZ protein